MFSEVEGLWVYLDFYLSQWNIADYLFQNRDTICVGLEGLRRAGNKTSSETRQSGQTAFEKSIQNSSLPVIDLLWMYMFRYIHVYTYTYYVCPVGKLNSLVMS